MKEVRAFTDHHIAVRLAYDRSDTAGQWFRSHGNERWQFDTPGDRN